MVLIHTTPPYCIDQFESSLVLLQDHSPWSPYFSPGTMDVRAVSLPGAIPQGYINGTQAAEACAVAGKRLCTDAEWLRACRGPVGYTYPYGETHTTDACNENRAMHPVVEYFGASDPSVFTLTNLNHQCLNQLHDSLDPTGTNQGCVAVEGVYDMMGNLQEWTADPQGTLRGGYYVDAMIQGNGCLYRTTAHSAGYSDYSTGFRCCTNVP
jgi:formylglycine-generating enzyme required for sulfatase activity